MSLEEGGGIEVDRREWLVVYLVAEIKGLADGFSWRWGKGRSLGFWLVQ